MNTSLLPRLLTISENFWLPKFQPPTDKSVLRVGFVFFRLLKRLYISLSFQSNGMIWIDKKRRENWKKEYQIKQVKNQVNWLCLLQGLRSNCFRPFHYLLTNQTQKFPWNIDQEIVVEKWKKANLNYSKRVVPNDTSEWEWNRNIALGTILKTNSAGRFIAVYKVEFRVEYLSWKPKIYNKY